MICWLIKLQKTDRWPIQFRETEQTKDDGDTLPIVDIFERAKLSYLKSQQKGVIKC